MISVIARLTAKEGQEAALEGLMAELAGHVREQEPGCKLYQLCKSQTPRQYVVIERYQDQQALTAHSQSAYFRAAFPKLGALLDGRAAIEVLPELP
jgi:quinol monooxygenase YgiN